MCCKADCVTREWRFSALRLDAYLVLLTARILRACSFTTLLSAPVAMATVFVVGIAGDVLQRNDSVADITKDKHIQISIASIEDDEISTLGIHSIDSLNLERSRQSIEGQVARLRQEIAVANSVLELCIREAVTASTTLQKKKLQERTNAAYTAWAAKELMLSDLLVCLHTFNLSRDVLLTHHRTRCRIQTTAQRTKLLAQAPGN